MNQRSRRFLLWTVVVIAVIIVCVAFVDRPVAVGFDSRFHASTVERIAASMFMLVDRALYVGAVILIVLATWLFAKRGRQRMLRRLVVAGAATAVSLGVTLLLKWAIGRSQVYPTFLRDGIYTVHLLRGMPLYGAFPSATMAGSTTFVTGLRLSPSVERMALMIVVILLSLALLVTSGHWLSDIIGGTWLGVNVGWLAQRFQLGESQSPPR